MPFVDPWRQNHEHLDMAAFRNERIVHPIKSVMFPSNQHTGTFEKWSIRYVHLGHHT